MPPPVHAGGLRYHGDAPSLCALVKEGIVEATAVKQTEAFAAAVRFAGCEGIVPGPEPAHAIKATIDEALAAKEAGEERVILLGLSGHGHFDMAPTRPTAPETWKISTSPRPKCKRPSAASPKPRASPRTR